MNPAVIRQTCPSECGLECSPYWRSTEPFWGGHLASIKATKHRIGLKPGSKPVRLNSYRMGPRTGELIKAQVDRILKLEGIEPIKSERASPVVLIPKPDGSPRFCIDYRQLNERTIRDSVAVLSTTTMVRRLAEVTP